MSNFTKLQIAWSRQVRHDHKLPARALHVADTLAFDFMNRDKLEAWPAMDTLCERVGLSEKTVRAVLGALEERGHLIKKSGGGRKKSNRYRWIIKDENTGKNAGVSDGKTPAKSKEFTRPKRKPNSGSFGSKTPAYLPEEPSEENRFKGGSAHRSASAYINGAVSSSSEDIELIDAYAAKHASDGDGTQGHEAPVSDPRMHDADQEPTSAPDDLLNEDWEPDHLPCPNPVMDAPADLPPVCPHGDTMADAVPDHIAEVIDRASCGFARLSENVDGRALGLALIKGFAFGDDAARSRSVATVHRALAEGGYSASATVWPRWNRIISELIGSADAKSFASELKEYFAAQRKAKAAETTESITGKEEAAYV